MKKVLVSLVSEHTIPNILAIYHFKPDELLFVTTKEMEKKKKVEAILETLSEISLNYRNSSFKVEVQEDSILDCHRKIESWIEGKEDSEFIINLTGGTKIMSISAYEFFKDYSSKMIYIPIPKNEFIVPFPKKSPGRPIELALRLTVVQYLAGYGLSVIKKEKLNAYMGTALKRKDLSAWIVNQYENLKDLLGWLSGNLREHRNAKEFTLQASYSYATEKEKEFIQRFGFGISGNMISRTLDGTEIKYLTGGWLEEYCFNEVLEFVPRERSPEILRKRKVPLSSLRMPDSENT